MLNFDKSYYRWREKTLKPSVRRTWKAKSHVRYLAYANANTLKWLCIMRKNNPSLWGRYN